MTAEFYFSAKKFCGQIYSVLMNSLNLTRILLRAGGGLKNGKIL